MEPIELLDHLDEGKTDVDLLDMDKLLKECGFTCRDYGHTLVYVHEEWGLDFTFDRSHRKIPRRYARHILDLVSDKLRGSS